MPDKAACLAVCSGVSVVVYPPSSVAFVVPKPVVTVNGSNLVSAAASVPIVLAPSASPEPTLPKRFSRSLYAVKFTPVDARSLNFKRSKKSKNSPDSVSCLMWHYSISLYHYTCYYGGPCCNHYSNNKPCQLFPSGCMTVSNST
jgi:hypothetical protein